VKGGRQDRQTAGAFLGRGTAGLLILVLAVTALLPFAVMISTSLMDEFEVFRQPPALLPADPRWENYRNALTAFPFQRFFANSLLFSTVVVFGQVATAATAGYAFARLKFPGRDRIFGATLGMLMVPVVVILIPRFLLINALGWVDTLHGLVVTELVSVWGIFLLRQAFQSREAVDCRDLADRVHLLMDVQRRQPRRPLTDIGDAVAELLADVIERACH